jgi:hypothetical protein
LRIIPFPHDDKLADYCPIGSSHNCHVLIIPVGSGASDVSGAEKDISITATSPILLFIYLFSLSLFDAGSLLAVMTRTLDQMQVAPMVGRKIFLICCHSVSQNMSAKVPYIFRGVGWGNFLREEQSARMTPPASIGEAKQNNLPPQCGGQTIDGGGLGRQCAWTHIDPGIPLK